MKLYKVEALGKKAKWVASQNDAAKARAAFMNSGSKRSDLSTTAVDIPTTRVGLLEFLNAQ